MIFELAIIPIFIALLVLAARAIADLNTFSERYIARADAIADIANRMDIIEFAEIMSYHFVEQQKCIY